MVGRGWGTISIKVPKDFGDKKLTWTLTANGKTVSVPVRHHQGLPDRAVPTWPMGNKPPVIKFAEKGELTGPPEPGFDPTVNGAVGEPVTLSYWVTDDGNEETPTGGGGARAAPPPGAGRGGPAPRRPRVSTTTLTKYRGPGTVTFADSTPSDRERTRFRRPRRSRCLVSTVIRIEGNDSSGVGGGGFQCCWTTAYIKVTVKAATTGGVET